MVEIHPSLLQRKIIHFDMDAFYASIEIRDDPRLRGKPVVIGGSPQSRSVVCTASYEARKYGIHSAMPCSQAARLCPSTIFLSPNFTKYQAASLQIRNIFKKYTEILEPLSLDEAYLDVTHHQKGLYAVQIARLIQGEVYQETGLTGSAGIAPNKLLAKIASDIRKPNGLTVVLPAQALLFMKELPLWKIPGIGPVTAKRLSAAGFEKCCDLWPFSLEEIKEKVGNIGDWLYHRARGIDERPVTTNWVRKSLGQEETFSTDLLSIEVLRAHILSLSSEVAKSLIQRNLKPRTITLKVKYADFTQVTRRRTLQEGVLDEHSISTIGLELLKITAAGTRKIRLLGISTSNFMGEFHGV